jgi:hypothetical protein
MRRLRRRPRRAVRSELEEETGTGTEMAMGTWPGRQEMLPISVLLRTVRQWAGAAISGSVSEKGEPTRVMADASEEAVAAKVTVSTVVVQRQFRRFSRAAATCDQQSRSAPQVLRQKTRPFRNSCRRTAALRAQAWS